MRDYYYRIEHAVFIGEMSESTDKLLSSIKLHDFKISFYTANSSSQLIHLCCKVENSLLMMDMNTESINIYLGALGIEFIKKLPVIAFADKKIEAYTRLAEELGFYRLFVRGESLRKDASELSKILTIKLQYPDLENYPEIHGHKVSENSWHDPETEITDYEKAISELIEKLGVKKTLSGHKYLVAAIAMHCSTFSPPEPKYLYQIVADHFGVTPSAVEKSIRYAIESAWTKGDLYLQNCLFGVSIDERRGKPTNAEFIARISLEFYYR